MSWWCTGKPGVLQSMGLQRVGQDWATELRWPLGFLVAQSVKNLPAVWETWVRSLGQEDPLEKEMSTHSSILAWKIPWAEEPGGLQSMGSQTEWLTLSLSFTLNLTLHFWKPLIQIYVAFGGHIHNGYIYSFICQFKLYLTATPTMKKEELCWCALLSHFPIPTEVLHLRL